MKKYIILISLLLATTSSQAGSFWCSGNIINSYIDNSGNVYLTGTWRGDHTQVCNMNFAWKGVSIDTCKTWVSYIQVAITSKAPVTMHYPDVPSCSEIPNYGAAPKPSYIMIKAQ